MCCVGGGAQRERLGGAVRCAWGLITAQVCGGTERRFVARALSSAPTQRWDGMLCDGSMVLFSSGLVQRAPSILWLPRCRGHGQNMPISNFCVMSTSRRAMAVLPDLQRSGLTTVLNTD